MIETFAALFFAHALADFVLQTGWMAARKRQFGVLLFHTAIVLVTAQLATGHVASGSILLLASAHLAIDVAKVWLGRGGLAPFLWDQAAHLVTIGAVAWAVPELWDTGLWAEWEGVPTLMLLTGGAIFAIRAGGYAVGLLVTPLATDDVAPGLPKAGQIIGQLERAILYLLVLVGEPTAVGFLIAAKSILRFDSAKDSRTAEYVIVGTLASFAWALAVAYAVRKLLVHLPPLEFLS